MKIWLLLIMLAISEVDFACMHIPPPPFEPELRKAKSIFIFRLLSTEMPSMAFDTQRTGRIEIFEVIRGQANFRQISFNVGWTCNGTHLDVGKYYLAYLVDNEGEFTGTYENIVEFNVWHLSSVREKVEAILTNPPRLNSERQELGQWYKSTEGMPAPPPPPPPPCPEPLEK